MKTSDRTFWLMSLLAALIASDHLIHRVPVQEIIEFHLQPRAALFLLVGSFTLFAPGLRPGLFAALA